MISFIILHYKNISDTIECLNNIKNVFKNKDYNIIVVDNNTLSKNEESVIKNYTTDILLLDKNYGFAKANNMGIEYAYEKYNSNFYCVINNDVFITQNNFIDIINNDYKKYNFDVLGPMIFSPTGESVNPFPAIVGKKNIENEIIRCNKLIKIYKNMFLTFVLNIFIKIKRIFAKPIVRKNSTDLLKNVPLHGCALIFSKKYIDIYNEALYNDTFLFHEEEFLFKRIIDNNLISIYDPKLEVFHKEGSSINSNLKNIRKSKLFREEKRLASLKLLLKEYEKKNEK